jgi:DNA-binding NtrC family response regulator
VPDALKILVVEDAESDFRLIERHLRRHGLEADCQRVATLDALSGALARSRVDLALVDYHIPGLEIQDSLGRIQTDAPGLPVILMSGSIGEEAAVDLLKQGVWDFVLKDRLARLVPAIESDLREALERMQLRLFYQPLVDKHTARISGYESVGTVHG